jgi:antitoxin component YwqK of YwqJK toxin-antitoxin module
MECYICLEKETKDFPFCENICSCKGYKIHKSCFSKLYEKQVCSICKTTYKNIDDLLPKRDGFNIIIEFDSLGLKHEYTKDENGLIQGIYKIWYPNGNIWEETYYKQGVKDGIQKLYDTRGNIYVQMLYENNQRID